MKYSILSETKGVTHIDVPREARSLIALGEGEKLLNGHLQRKAIKPAPTALDVKAEAERRILERFPMWRQINAMRGGDIADMISTIDTIRADSNRIEALGKIPIDYRDDRHWSFPTLATDRVLPR